MTRLTHDRPTEPRRSRRSQRSIAALLAATLFGLASCQDDSTLREPPPPPIPSRPAKIAVLYLDRRASGGEPAIGDFRAGVEAFQLVEGKHFVLDVVDLGGDAAAVAGAIDREADVILIAHGDVLRAAADLRPKRPIVFGILGDLPTPSLANSSGGPAAEPDVSGVYLPPPTVATLALAKEYMPKAKRIGLVVDRREPRSRAHSEAMGRDALGLGLEVASESCDGVEGGPAALEALLARSIDAVCLVDGSGALDRRVIERAAAAKRPTFGFTHDQVAAGALASEIPRADRVGREAGKIVGRMLRNLEPLEPSVRRLEDVSTLVAPRVAEALGLTLPPGALRNAEAFERP